MSELHWKSEQPTSAGRYWYRDPSSHEHPTLVRVESDAGVLRVYFPRIAMPVPLAMLSRGRWAPAPNPPSDEA